MSRKKLKKRSDKSNRFFFVDDYLSVEILTTFGLDIAYYGKPSVAKSKPLRVVKN